MRIGLVIYGSLDTLSGGYLYDRMLVRQLQAEGHQVELLALPWRNYARHLGDNTNLRWLRRLADADVDVLIQDELNHPSLLMANCRRNRPVVSLVHHLRSSEIDHPPLLQALYRQIERMHLNSVDALLCNSYTTLDTVKALLSQPKPYHVAYPAADHLPAAEPTADLLSLAQRARQEGPLRLLFVGNLIRRKGLHVVLDALAALPHDQWRLSVVGQQAVDPGYTASILRRCRSLPPGAVTFLGRLSDDQLIDAYRSHHLLVLPSYEGYGIVYLEAMRFGLPVIAATAGAAREIVTDGENGFLVDAGNAAALKLHVGALHANRERLLAMSYAARRYYVNHLSWQQSMAGASAWLTTLVQGTI